MKSSTNIISNNIYSEKDNTVKLLSALIKNDKNINLAVDKESCTVIINKSDYIKKVNDIIEDEEGMLQGKKPEILLRATSSIFKVFFTGILKNKNIMIKCVQFLTNQVDSLQQLKHTILHH